MKQHFARRCGSSSLTILFAGWGMDSLLVEPLGSVSGDLMVCYDYTDLDFNPAAAAEYDRLHVAGWSMGVWAASAVCGGLKPDSAVAVNGTPWPVDDMLGIPEAVFEATLRTLSPLSLQKFRRRMCGSQQALELFMSHEPARGFEDLRSELAAIARAVQCAKVDASLWTDAVVGAQDLIFPAANQLRAWQKAGVDAQTVQAAHYSAEILWEAIS